MFTLTKIRIALLLVILLPAVVHAQKPKSYTAVTTELSQKIIDAPSACTPQSLAVVPFMATASSAEQSKAFGEYLRETIITSIAGILKN